MNIRNKPILLICGLTILTLTLSKRGEAQLVLYDDLTSCQINPSKWSGAQNYDPDIRESVRRIVGENGDRHLRLLETAYSSTSDDVGGSGGGFGLNFARPDSVTETSFSVVVTRAEATGCRSNPSLAVIDAEFRGSFFNTEVSPINQTGDVVADIDIERNPADMGDSLNVAGFYSRCDDQFCSTSTLLDYRSLGTIHIGDEAKLRIKWDQPNHRFIFQLNHLAEVISAYTVSDITAPVSNYKAIQLARVVPHCTDKHRPFASMSAAFNDVYVNP